MSRNLTGGEVTLVRSIFLQSVNCSSVKVHQGTYIFFQPDNTLMTPNGEIYAPKNTYKADYATESIEWQAIFIHEMTHVWQYQNNILDPRGSGIRELFRNRFSYGNAYFYTLTENKTLTDYYMEQQAAIVEEYFRVIKSGGSFSRHCQNQESVADKTELLKNVVGGTFLAN